MDSIYHYTVSTGHGRWSSRSEVADDVIARIGQALGQLAAQTPEPQSDEFVLPVAILPGNWGIQFPLEAESGGLRFALGRGNTLIVRCWLMTTPEQAAELWREVVHFGEQEDALPLSECPELPCLAVVPLLDAPVDRETWEAVGDFERCVAWTLLEAQND